MKNKLFSLIFILFAPLTFAVTCPSPDTIKYEDGQYWAPGGWVSWQRAIPPTFPIGTFFLAIWNIPDNQNKAIVLCNYQGGLNGGLTLINPSKNFSLPKGDDWFGNKANYRYCSSLNINDCPLNIYN